MPGLSLRLGTATFPSVMCASGAMGFFGEGYPFHEKLGPFKPDFSGIMLVSKTATFRPRLGPDRGGGNMPLKTDGLTPTELKPACIHVTPRMWLGGYALNAVGLSNPGIRALLFEGHWQKRTDPTIISVMCVGGSSDERMFEMRGIAAALERVLPEFSAPVAIELNVSCSNTGRDPEDDVRSAEQLLNIANRLRRPVLVKVDLLAPDDMLFSIARHPTCSGITMSNAIPWRSLPDRIDWKKLFGTDASPLAHLSGGALSGAPLLPLVLERILRLKDAGFTKPIVACGGILSPEDARVLIKVARVDAIQIGSAAFLRPWRIQKIARAAHDAFCDR